MKNQIDQNTLKKPELNDYNLTEEKVSIYKEQLKVFEEEQKKINEYNRELRRDQEKADSNAWGWALIGFVIGGFITAMLSQNNDGFGIFIGIIAGFGLPVLFYRMYKGNCNAYIRSEKKLDKFGIVDKDLESNYINYKKALWTYELEMNRRTRQFWIELVGFEFEEEIANLLNSLGAKAKLTPKVSDGGIDIIVIYNENQYAIQCKNHSKPVGPKDVRELRGVITSTDKYHKGVFISTNGYTASVKEENKVAKCKIKLLELKDIINLSKTKDIINFLD